MDGMLQIELALRQQEKIIKNIKRMNQFFKNEELEYILYYKVYEYNDKVKLMKIEGAEGYLNMYLKDNVFEKTYLHFEILEKINKRMIKNEKVFEIQPRPFNFLINVDEDEIDLKDIFISIRRKSEIYSMYSNYERIHSY